MSTNAEATVTYKSRTEATERVTELEERIEQLERELANTVVAEQDDEKSMVIIATQGTLDMAYPPLILSSTTAAFIRMLPSFTPSGGLKSFIMNGQRT